MSKGQVYLHTNGDLIYKPHGGVEFDSPFVKKVWPCDTKNRANAWTIVLEALALGCQIERARNLAKKWGLTKLDSFEMLRRVKPTNLMKEGLNIFVKEILEMNIEDYWREVQFRFWKK